MRAVVLVRTGKSDRAFEFKELPDPKPEPHEIRVEVEASGLNFADVLARLGLYREAPPLPSVLGYEVVGRIDALGDQVADLKKGQRVLAFTRFGGYASKAVTSSLAAVPVPESFDAATATALGTQYSTAYFAAEEMVRVHPGNQVLIHAAAGGVGTALVQLTKLRGCSVYGTTGSEAKMDYLSQIGVDFPINSSTGDFSREFLKHSRGRRPDVIFDSIGGASVRKGIQLLSSGGRMVCYGVAEMAGGKTGFLKTLKTAASFGWPHPLSFLIHSKAMIGINMLKIADDRPDILSRCLKAVVKMTIEGKLTPRLGRVFRAAQIAEAHEFLGSRKSTGKVAISW